jgi:uncharacterized protein YbaR (Trm112 family)
MSGKQIESDITRGHEAGTIKPRDLELLGCPVCHSELVLQVAKDAVQTHIACTGCGRGYPIVDGLPILLERKRPSDI